MIGEILFNQTEETAPAGVHNAMCVGAYDLHLQPGYQGGAPQREILFLFETEKKKESGRFAGEPYQLRYQVTVNFSKISKLMKMLRSWPGSQDILTRNSEGKTRFMPDNIVGKQVSLLVSNYDKDGEKKAKIEDVMPASPNAPKMTTEFDPESTPDWIKRIQDRRLDGPLEELRSCPEVTLPEGDGAETTEK